MRASGPLPRVHWPRADQTTSASSEPTCAVHSPRSAARSASSAVALPNPICLFSCLDYCIIYTALNIVLGMFGPAYAQPKQTIGVPPAPPTIPSDMALKLSEQIGEYREISKRVDTLTADVKEISLLSRICG